MTDSTLEPTTPTPADAAVETQGEVVSEQTTATTEPETADVDAADAGADDMTIHTAIL